MSPKKKPPIKKKVKKNISKKAAPKPSAKQRKALKPKKKIDTMGTPSEDTPKKELSEEEKALVLGARKRKQTPSIFKVKQRKVTPIVFSLEDIDDIIKNRPQEEAPTEPLPAQSSPRKLIVGKGADLPDPKRKKQMHGAASLSDILGFNPKERKDKPHLGINEADIPKKFKKYYKALLELREHVRDGLELHTRDTLKRSSKDDSGDLSSYSQHMADAGTDTFDRDFALSMLSSEQDALFEIEEAIVRIADGTYGICEITGKPIAKERLEAVPFTRYSLEGQKQLESTRQKGYEKERGGVFAESSIEESARYTEEGVED